MDASIVVAIVALVGAVVSAAIAAYGQLRSSTLTTRREAEAVLRKFREPLLGAAYELQGRLWNIIELDFLNTYYRGGDDAQREYALQNTLYVVAQYFGWSEILRHEIQFLNFSSAKRTRDVNKIQREIVQLFQSDRAQLGRPFLIWRGEQRAIGEMMVEKDADPPRCMGYASFLKQKEPAFRRWFTRLEGELDEVADEGPNPRLFELQRGLVKLIRELDPDGLRYSDDELREVYAGPR